MPLPTHLHQALLDGLGPRGILTDPPDLLAHEADWRGRYRGRAGAVLRPASTQEVATAVRLCHRAGVVIVPQGGNTGLCGGAVPDASGDQVVLHLGRMRHVRAVDPVEDTITVEAGTTLHVVQQAAARAGRLFPMTLGSQGSCTIGGNLATNAGGSAVLRYGMMRDLTLGLEVVLPDGRVWDGLRPLRKDNTGYDLKQLFIGAEGTLGVITAAVLRLFPATPSRATAWVAMPDVGAAVDVLGILRERAGELLTTWEVMSREALEVVLANIPDARDPFTDAMPWNGLIELSGSASTVDIDERLEGVLGECVERGLLTDAVVAGSPAQRESLWSLREGISEAQGGVGPSIKHDITVPIATMASFVAQAESALQATLPGVRFITYGHIGDGNLHYNLSKPVGSADDDFLALSDRLSAQVHAEVAALGGSVSAEHGVGVAKREAVWAVKSAVELDLMRMVKQALDPDGRMNPGKVLPD